MIFHIFAEAFSGDVFVAVLAVETIKPAAFVT